MAYVSTEKKTTSTPNGKHFWTNLNYRFSTCRTEHTPNTSHIETHQKLGKNHNETVMIFFFAYRRHHQMNPLSYIMRLIRHLCVCITSKTLNRMWECRFMILMLAFFFADDFSLLLCLHIHTATRKTFNETNESHKKENQRKTSA